MHPILTVAMAVAVIGYLFFQILLHITQDKREPRMIESRLPFMDAVIGMMSHKTRYFEYLRSVHNLPIHTLRLPFQRNYVIHDPYLVQVVQSKANGSTYVPNLLDFGMLFSGLNMESRQVLGKGFKVEGNSFTMGVHKYLLSGITLGAATKVAVDILSASIPNSTADHSERGLLEYIKHELAMSFTGAIYGPENPYHDSEIEQSWNDFVPGIMHLLTSPFPSITARKAMAARRRVTAAFQRYFETGGHMQAYAMIPEMYENNQRLGLEPNEAAKMEMATSLAMLSSGANTTFWFVSHLLSDGKALDTVRQELYAISSVSSESDIPQRRALDLTKLKAHCPTLLAIFNETLRVHSSVINIKQVQHDTTLANQYLLKKDGQVMIPGASIHLNKDIWGPDADTFDHRRFLSSVNKKKLSSTSAFRPFGAGATMCPGRHFSTNVIMSFAAMVVLQYDIVPEGGVWVAPTKRNADFWNAMPKPDWDINVQIAKRSIENDIEWKFMWESDEQVL